MQNGRIKNYRTVKIRGGYRIIVFYRAIAIGGTIGRWLTDNFKTREDAQKMAKTFIGLDAFDSRVYKTFVI